MPAVGDSPTSIRDARAFARSVCADDGVSADLCQALEVVMSELVGNAVRHGRHPVSFEVEREGRDVLVVVMDADATPPGDGECCDLDSEGGRGLFLVSQLSQQWGWYSSGTGKRVWARI